MDCNKEEAIRAKDIAEKKMQTKDFIGAKKVVLKAQLLFPDLDNISQMLTVCEVHCSAGVKVNGETDLYGILQVEPTADESLIKKQYRKLALLLHPDKNKFAGAEAAFKLIGEANMTLSDPVKRSVYDMKRKSNNRSAPFRQFSQHRNSTYVRKQTRAPNNSSNNTTARANGINQQQQPSAFSAVGTFWTSCPFCTMKYQYYLSILNKQIRCYSCLKTFITYDMNAQAVPPSMNSGYSWSHTQTPQQEFPVQHAHNAGLQSNHGNASSSMGFQGNAGGGFTASQPLSSSGTNTDLGSRSTKKAEDGKLFEEGGAGNNVKFEEEKFKQANKSKRVVKPSAGNASRKRVRKIAESSDSDSTDSEDMVIEEDGNPEEQKAGTAGSHYPRRSTRHKKNVTYNEDDGSEDDNDFVSPPSLERFRKGGSSCNVGQSDKRFSHKIDYKQKGVPHEENLPNGNKPVNKFKMHDSEQGAGEEVKAKAEDSSNADSSSKISPDVGSFSYPDPEFGDFEKNRDASQFAIGQIWSIYDNLDGMPRFYARIGNVCTPDFKVRYTWLEHNPVGEAELAWSEGELPIACGNYTLGKTESTQDRLLFSHLISWGKGTNSRKKSYTIYPRKGEVWALFKGWDICWSSDAKRHRDYEYEVVEVLSDFAEGTDIVVDHLVRIKGFVCLFMGLKDKGMASLSIPPDEMLRFSHMVPSYRLARGEREGVPEGCFELDSASLPPNLEEAFPAVSLDDESGGFFYKYAADAEKLATGTVKKSAELNDKNVCETEDTSGGLSAKGVRGSCEKKHNQASTRDHVAADARKNVETESVAPKHMVDEKVNVEARNPNGGSAAEQCSPSPAASPSPISFECPDSEFYDFREERSIEKFQCGQVWALYSDVNEFPNYYGCINSVELEDFKLHVTWLVACSSQKETARWSEDLPVACGTFKASDDAVTFDAVDVFSHLVHVKPSTEKNRYDIFPCVGEVWAIFKNWSVGWTRADLHKCEYDVAEVLEQASSGVKVLALTKVNGYRAVFMPESKGGVMTSMEISESECLRFSHRIPAFRLTDERGGKLRGYWELDPSSLPEIFLL